MSIRKVKLGSLKVGQWFRIGEREGFLLCANDCRARVRLPGKRITVKDVEFETRVEQDWGPDTEVEPLEVYGGVMQEVKIEEMEQ